MTIRTSKGDYRERILGSLRAITKEISSIRSESEYVYNERIRRGQLTINVLSWDCGMKSTSWTYMSINSTGVVSIISQGTIDFLEGKKIKSVSADEWPNKIHSGMSLYAPTVTQDTVVVIENQTNRHRGTINSANLATQYSIGLWYHANKILFLNATHKNKIGPITIESLAKKMSISGEKLRKLHTRINYELFLKIFYGNDTSFIKTKIKKIRDLADSFAQGLYVLAKLYRDALEEMNAVNGPYDYNISSSLRRVRFYKWR